MVHVNADDGSRVFIPYVGGFDRYVASARHIAARGYEGFLLRDHRGESHVIVDTMHESAPENPGEAVILAE
jgi:hypothetical protein